MEKEKLENVVTEEKEVEEFSTDADGVVTNLTEIRKQKDLLLKIYKELDGLDVNQLNDEIEQLQKEIENRVDVLKELEFRAFERQEKLREEQIQQRQRIGIHYKNTKPEVIKEADEPKIPWKYVILLMTGLLSLYALITIVVFLLCK